MTGGSVRLTRVPYRGIGIARNEFDEIVAIPDSTIEGPPGAALALDKQWTDNYCHWIFDVLTDALIYLKMTGTKPQLVVNEKIIHGSFAPSYLDLLGFTDRRLRLPGEETASVTNPLAYTSRVHPWTVEELRKLIPKAVQAYPSTPKRLFIQRHGGKIESRNLVERDELLKCFAQTGEDLFMLYCEGIPVLQQITLFAQADLIIGCHGSALSNLIYCKPGCKVIEIASVSRHNSTYAEVGAMLGLPMISLEAKEQTFFAGRDYALRLDLEEILQAVEEL